MLWRLQKLAAPHRAMLDGLRLRPKGLDSDGTRRSPETFVQRARLHCIPAPLSLPVARQPSSTVSRLHSLSGAAVISFRRRYHCTPASAFFSPLRVANCTPFAGATLISVGVNSMSRPASISMERRTFRRRSRACAPFPWARIRFRSCALGAMRRASPRRTTWSSPTARAPTRITTTW